MLITYDVRFLIVGAHALAAAGRPRATQDLDILVEPTGENASRLGRALFAFGFPRLANEAHRFAEPDRMARLGMPPLQIDLLTTITGVSFESAWQGRDVAAIDGHQVPILGRRHLIENKSAAGRPKDLADIALLEESE